jgi:hypothetical protein
VVTGQVEGSAGMATVAVAVSGILLIYGNSFLLKRVLLESILFFCRYDHRTDDSCTLGGKKWSFGTITRNLLRAFIIFPASRMHWAWYRP